MNGGRCARRELTSACCRSLCEYCLLHLLLKKNPEMFSQHFVECIFHFNSYSKHKSYNKFSQSERWHRHTCFFVFCCECWLFIQSFLFFKKKCVQREGSLLAKRSSTPREAFPDLPLPVGELHRRPALQHHQQDQPDSPG